ncbi:MAG: hypothetical protein MUE44_13345 [Oscillatoriaceae cyanobacterium Prado104]|nr:hypothetical protein [Oscillatoriaceae cyanobacterium Prado104]
MNKYQPHVLVLPEDDANRQIANGFILNSSVNELAIQVLPIANGWEKVVDSFKKNHVSEMRKFTQRMIVLLMDFDEDCEDRLSYVKEQIPDDLENRVFVIGVLSEPEKLRSDLRKNFEKIGETLANDCSDNTNQLWGHALLKHNKNELDRMIISIKPFLFNND